jgi:hypothetical protein
MTDVLNNVCHLSCALKLFFPSCLLAKFLKWNVQIKLYGLLDKDGVSEVLSLRVFRWHHFTDLCVMFIVTMVHWDWPLSCRLLQCPLDLLRIPEMFVVLFVFLIQIQLRHIIYDNQSRENGSRDEFRKAFISNASHSIDSVQRTINIIRQPLRQIFRQPLIF